MSRFSTTHRILVGSLALVLLVTFTALGVFDSPASASGPTVTISCSQSGASVACTANYQLASGTTATGFLWDFGDGVTSTAQNPPVHAYTKPGTYRITFTVTDSTGQHGSASTTVTWAGPPTQSSPTPTPASSGGGTSGCPPGTHAPPISTVLTSDTHNLTNLNCVPDTTSSPTPPPSNVQPQPISITGMSCSPNPAQVNQPVSCGATVNHPSTTVLVSTNWAMGDGTVFTANSTPAHPYAACGSYIVTLTAADSAGGAAQQLVSVSVIGCQNVSPTTGTSDTTPHSVVCNGVLIQATQCPADSGSPPSPTGTCPSGSPVTLGGTCPQPCTPAIVLSSSRAVRSDPTSLFAMFAANAHTDLPLASNSVHYAAGWNIVAAPSGSLLPGATNPFFAFGPGSTAYQPLAPGDVVGGRAVWAYFPSPTDVPLGATAATFASVLAPASQWVLIGNPNSATALPLHGADAAMAYTPSQGYVSTDVLQPGQGAWVLRFQGGAISVGTAGSAASEIGRLQAAITADPTDRSTFNRIATTTSELLQGRLYSQVQTAIDDLWSAAADGLVEHGAGALPALSNGQRDAASAVREALAQAATAAQAGDLAAADHAVEKAQAAAKASTDDGLAIAQGQASIAFAAAGSQLATSIAANNLAAFGALLHAAVFSIGLGQAPSDAFWSVATALINGTAVPQAAGCRS